MKAKKNIYKIPIKLIIDGLSKAPLCIWTTVVSVGKGYTALPQQFIVSEKITEKKKKKKFFL